MIPHPDSEIFFRFSRSSGKGGQHVNKVSTKVELNFDVKSSKLLTEEQKQLILLKQQHRINKNGVLKIIVHETRSQRINKEIAVKKFMLLIENCFRKTNKRIPVKVSKVSKEKRLFQKRRHSELKKNRSGQWL